MVGGTYAEHTWVGTHRGTARHAYLHSFDIKKRDHDFNEEKVVSRQKPEQEERFPSTPTLDSKDGPPCLSLVFISHYGYLLKGIRHSLSLNNNVAKNNQIFLAKTTKTLRQRIKLSMQWFSLL